MTNATITNNNNNKYIITSFSIVLQYIIFVNSELR